MRAIALAVFLLLSSLPVFSAEPYRIIAIMENERLLNAEPDLQLIRFFSSEDPKIRARATGDPSSLLFALKALWTIKKPLTVEEADRLLQHPDQRVRQNTLDVFAASGEKSSCEAIEKHLDTMTILTKGKAIESLEYSAALTNWNRFSRRPIQQFTARHYRRSQRFRKMKQSLQFGRTQLISLGRFGGKQRRHWLN